MKKLKEIPKFKSLAEEENFWAKHDSTEYINYSKVGTGLSTRTETIEQNHLDSAA